MRLRWLTDWLILFVYLNEITKVKTAKHSICIYKRHVDRAHGLPFASGDSVADNPRLRCGQLNIYIGGVAVCNNSA